MLVTLKDFLYMNGYGGYVFSSYSCVFGLLAIHWVIAWRRWRRYFYKRKIFT